MRTPRQKLINAIESAGWEIEEIFGSELDWWADEIWRLHSRRAPSGGSCFVTFLVDPQHEGPRRKGQSIWGVSVSSMFPKDRREAEAAGTVSLNSIAKGRLSDFIENLNSFLSRT